MARSTTQILGGWAIFLLAVTAATARDVYVLPAPGTPQVNDIVRLQMVTSDPQAGSLSGALESGTLQRLWNSGRSHIDGGAAEGFRSDEPGVQLIAYSAPGEQSKRPTCFSKTMFVVGNPRDGGKIWRSELGQRLEIVLLTDPVRLARKPGTVEIQVLLDREPLAGATVVAARRGSVNSAYRRDHTDLAGRVRFNLDKPGWWMIHLASKSSEGSEILDSSLLLPVALDR